MQVKFWDGRIARVTWQRFYDFLVTEFCSCCFTGTLLLIPRTTASSDIFSTAHYWLIAMGEMEQLRKEADSLKDQITVSWPQYIICGRSSIIHILFCLTCVHILFLTALCVCVLCRQLARRCRIPHCRRQQLGSQWWGVSRWRPGKH